MAVREFKAPDMLGGPNSIPHMICPGCSHGVGYRLVYEVIEEMGMFDKQVPIHDVACGANMSMVTTCDMIGASHGRPVPTACGVKRIRPDKLVFTYQGDGSYLSIGMQHTMHAAIRNEKITAIVLNNNEYGMTGGQMSPATLLGQKTTSSPMGRLEERTGKPVDIIKCYQGLDIAYAARGALDTPAHIAQAKKYIRKAFEKQMAGEGFTYVELLGMCPTNWGMTALQAKERVANEVIPVFPIGEFIERSAE